MGDNSDKRTLYVGGLEENVDEAIVHSAFIPFGDIVDVNIPIEQTTRASPAPPEPFPPLTLCRP